MTDHTNETIDAIIERHAEAKGADHLGTTWAKRQARNGIEAGLHESEAILAAFNELDLWMQLEPRINRSVAEQCVRDAGMEAQA